MLIFAREVIIQLSPEPRPAANCSVALLQATAADKGQVVVYDTRDLAPGSDVAPLRRLSVSAIAACSDLLVTSVAWMGENGAGSGLRLAAGTAGRESGKVVTWAIDAPPPRPSVEDGQAQGQQQASCSSAPAAKAAAALPLCNGELAAAQRAEAMAGLANGHARAQDSSAAPSSASSSAAASEQEHTQQPSPAMDGHCSGPTAQDGTTSAAAAGATAEPADPETPRSTLEDAVQPAPASGDEGGGEAAGTGFDSPRSGGCDPGVAAETPLPAPRYPLSESSPLPQHPQPPLTPSLTSPGSSSRRPKRPTRRTTSQISLRTNSTTSDFLHVRPPLAGALLPAPLCPSVGSAGAHRIRTLPHALHHRYAVCRDPKRHLTPLPPVPRP